ncbi:MAG: hypothetical protein ACR2PL_18905 [Dehalococcoidia bacterium]
MIRLLLLAGLGFAGFTVAKRFLGQNNAAPDADDFYGSADLHAAESPAR